MNSSDVHIVCGTDQCGGHLVNRLLARGGRVRTVRRSAEVSRHPMREVMQTDTLDRGTTVHAAAGAAVVYHCAYAPFHECIPTRGGRSAPPGGEVHVPCQ